MSPLAQLILHTEENKSLVGFILVLQAFTVCGAQGALCPPLQLTPSYQGAGLFKMRTLTDMERNLLGGCFVKIASVLRKRGPLLRREAVVWGRCLMLCGLLADIRGLGGSLKNELFFFH